MALFKISIKSVGIYIFILLIGVASLQGAEGLIKLHNLTIEQAEIIAIDHNNQINSLKELYKKAKEGRLESYSKWMPELSAMSDMYIANKKQVFTNSKSAFLTQLSLTQSILSMDKYYDVKIASLIEEQFRLLLNAAVIDVLFELRSFYYQVILDYEMIEAAKEKIDLLTSLARRMEDRYNIGTSILYGVNQSKVAIANATSDYYEVVKKQKVDMDLLVSSLGYDPGEVELSFADLNIPIEQIPLLKQKLCQMQPIFEKDHLALNENIYKKGYPMTEIKRARMLFSQAEMDYWEDKALEYEPSLKVYKNQVNIAKKEVSKNYGQYAPKVTLNANYGGDPTTLIFVPATSFTGQKFQWGVGVQLRWMLFDGLGRERRIRQAQYQEKSKRYEYKKELQKTYANVREQIFNIEESVATFVTADANVKLATQTVELANDQMDIGYVTIFDYQITVDSLIQALNKKNKARYDLIKAYYGLRHASGIDLEGS